MKKNIVYSILILATVFQSCSQYLDVKPDKSLAIPNNLRDLQALLDDEDRMTNNYPVATDIGADFYFLLEADWLSRTVDVRNTYVWENNAQNESDWSSSYTRVFYCNVVLDEVDQVELGGLTAHDRREIKGRAHFFRGWSFFLLSQTFSPHYFLGSEDSEFGLPLKLRADINEAIVRSTVKATYEQIIHDLRTATDLLPEQSSIATRPSKAAAFAALARVHLIMGDYEASLACADSSLSINSELINYNTLDPVADLPFEVVNKEVLFHAVTSANSQVHYQSRAYVDSLLMNQYHENDLRTSLFFVKEANGYYRFKGRYTGSANTLLAGLAIDEVYLTKAECEARLGKSVAALQTLNALLKTRWEADKFIPIEDLSGSELLDLILIEREKQLVFRGGIRWSDLRRLNKEPRYAKTLIRNIGNQTYTLPPNDLRYTFLLPFEVIQMSGIKQNPRE